MASISKTDRIDAKDNIANAVKLLNNALDRIGGHPGTQRNPKHVNPYMAPRVSIQDALDACAAAIGDLNDMDADDDAPTT
jgi:hypothetical protein